MIPNVAFGDYARAKYSLLTLGAVAVAAASPWGFGPIITMTVAVAVAVALTMASGGIPRTRDDIRFAALDLYSWSRDVRASIRYYFVGTLLITFNDPLNWKNTLFPITGRPITVGRRVARAFRVLPDDPADLPALRPAALPALHLYLTSTEPGKEEWRRCEEFSGFYPNSRLFHVLDLYDEMGAALGVSISIQIVIDDPEPMRRMIVVRDNCGDIVATISEVAPIGGLGPGALIKAAIAKWKV